MFLKIRLTGLFVCLCIFSVYVWRFSDSSMIVTNDIIFYGLLYFPSCL